MSKHDHLRPVTLPPALASATTHGFLPSSAGSELLVPLLNEQHRQALHVHQLLGGASQLQSTFANSLCDPNSPCFCLQPLKLRIDTGQVIVQFAVVHDIRSDTPVIKSVGCFGEVSMNHRGTNKKLVEPGREGVDGLRRVDRTGIDRE